jgi:hypothetical protein
MLLLQRRVAEIQSMGAERAATGTLLMGLMPYGGRQPGGPRAARSAGAQIRRNSFAWVRMEHRH